MPKQDNQTPTTETPQGNSHASLMAKLGIDVSQIEVATPTKKDVTISNNADQLKVNLKESTLAVNTKLGKMISFTTLKRDGVLKDAEGNNVKDENEKNVPRYIKTRMQGLFVIDETQDGFFQVTKGVHYTETHLVNEFTEIK
tara:strand:+ start:505 stop:930 length:426 start_codon:yes stop_codon:yes gene_type:complete